VRAFLKRWLDDSAKPLLRARTFQSYREIVTLHLRPNWARWRLSKLSPQDVQAMLTRKQSAALSPRRVQMIRAVLRKALGQALKWGLVGRNVTTHVDPPRVRYAEIRPLTPEQACTLLMAAGGDRLEALYSVAIALGLREGEALGLKWESVDLEARTRLHHKYRHTSACVQCDAPVLAPSRISRPSSPAVPRPAPLRRDAQAGARRTHARGDGDVGP
jgi:integrase